MHAEVISTMHNGRASLPSGFQRLQQQDDSHSASSQPTVETTVPVEQHRQESHMRRHRQQQNYNQVQTTDDHDVDDTSMKGDAVKGAIAVTREQSDNTPPLSVIDNPLWPMETTREDEKLPTMVGPTTRSPFSFDENDADFEEIVFDEALASTNSSVQQTRAALQQTPAVPPPSLSSPNDDIVDSHASNVANVMAISWSEHLLWTILIWMVTLIIALSSRELGVISSLTGTVAASTLGYTLPALIFFRCHLSQWNELLSLIRECCCMPSASSAMSASSSSTLAHRPVGRDLREIIGTEMLPLLRLFMFPSLLLTFGVATFLIGVTTVLVNS